MSGLHPSLRRLVQRHGDSSGQLPGDPQPLLESISQAFHELDRDRRLLERALELSSKELSEANASLRGMLAALPDLVLWTDRAGTIQEYHVGRTADLLTATPLLGKSILRTPHAAAREAIAGAYEVTLSTGRPTSAQYAIHGPAQTRHYEARLSGQPNGRVLVVIRNMTDRKLFEEHLENMVLERTAALQEANLELEAAKNEAERANHSKSEFLANMSHELRTPLHGMLSFAEFGLDEAETVAPHLSREYFRPILESGRILLTLLNDLLDLARIDAGRVEYTLDLVDLHDLVVETRSEFRSRLRERNLTLLTPTRATPVLVRGDALRLGQVLRNVIGNAIKFARTCIEIRLEIHAAHDRVQIVVRDDGPGIPADELVAIFEKFVQSTRTRSGAGGTGLGLAICRGIVADHGGRIWAESGPEDPGSALFIELPLGESPHLSLERDAA